MTIPTSALAYTDCYEAMDAALEDSHGVRIPVDDMDAATFFRMRVHQARKLARERNAQVYDKGHPLYASSEYDKLVCRIRKSNDQMYLYIEQIPSLSGKIEPLSEIEEPEEVPEEEPPPKTIPRRL